MKIQISKKFIHQKYVIEKLTQQKIADIVGCSGATVLRRMQEYGIKTRSRAEISRASWAAGFYSGNAAKISQQHKSGQRAEIYKEISKSLKHYFSNSENRNKIKGENSHRWKGGEVIRVCEICGDSFSVPSCLVERGWGRFCSTKCQSQWQSEALSGKNSPNWMGGDKEYPITFNKKFKETIRRRDSFRCRICGKKENGRSHDVHHINYIKSDTTKANCITLCITCHRKTNHNRDYWQERLSDLQQTDQEEAEQNQ